MARSARGLLNQSLPDVVRRIGIGNVIASDLQAERGRIERVARDLDRAEKAHGGVATRLSEPASFDNPSSGPCRDGKAARLARLMPPDSRANRRHAPTPYLHMSAAFALR